MLWAYTSRTLWLQWLVRFSYGMDISKKTNSAVKGELIYTTILVEHYSTGHQRYTKSICWRKREFLECFQEWSLKQERIGLSGYKLLQSRRWRLVSLLCYLKKQNFQMGWRKWSVVCEHLIWKGPWNKAEGRVLTPNINNSYFCG